MSRVKENYGRIFACLILKCIRESYKRRNPLSYSFLCGGSISSRETPLDD